MAQDRRLIDQAERLSHARPETFEHRIERRMREGLAEAQRRGLDIPATFPALMAESAARLAQQEGQDVGKARIFATNLALALTQPVPAAVPAQRAADEAAPAPQTLAFSAVAGTQIPPLKGAASSLHEWQQVDPEALEAEVITHAPSGTDVWTELFNHHHTGIVTTRHAASSYDQPVVLVGGELVDYAWIATLHLLAASEDDWQRVARALAPLGVRVTRQPGP